MGDRNPIEMFFKLTSGIGVDIFFFLSAYSLAGRDYSDYVGFLRSRFINVYLKYLLLAVIAAVVVGWKLKLFLKVVTGIDLFDRGGGAFLWFLPAIMILYILFPWFQKADEKNRAITLGVILLVWCSVAFACTQFKSAHHIFIFWNRVPVFLLGYYSARLSIMEKVFDDTKPRLLLGIVFTVVGYWLIYQFGYHTKLHIPFRDMFYIIYIPASVGLILLVGMVPESKVIKWIGSSTLEMYGVQMIFGYSFANKVLNATGSKGITNLLTCLYVIIIAVIARTIYDAIKNKLSGGVKK